MGPSSEFAPSRKMRSEPLILHRRAGSFPVTRFLSTESTSRFRRHVRLSAGSGPDSALSSRESSVRLVRLASCGRSSGPTKLQRERSSCPRGAASRAASDATSESVTNAAPSSAGASLSALASPALASPALAAKLTRRLACDEPPPPEPPLPPPRPSPAAASAAAAASRKSLGPPSGRLSGGSAMRAKSPGREKPGALSWRLTSISPRTFCTRISTSMGPWSALLWSRSVLRWGKLRRRPEGGSDPATLLCAMSNPTTNPSR
mmetsp:Transcript_11367/g.26704  ORF Transcript_11367/g.26704 Transcript_11367/m.26704 type:complete len:262 (-) Transcript_11367:620-1405(-)